VPHAHSSINLVHFISKVIQIFISLILPSSYMVPSKLSNPDFTVYHLLKSYSASKLNFGV